MNPIQPDELAGRLRVAPGLPCPHNLLSSRRDWTALLTRGLPATALSSRLANLFSLCGQAHRLCADMAVATALGCAPARDLNAAKLLQFETLREHARRIMLDWPGQLASGPAQETTRQQALAALRHCPLFGAAAPGLAASQRNEPVPGLQQWLGEHMLGMPAPQWLAHWEQDPAAWLRAWCDDAPGWLAGLLRQARPLADRVTPAAPLLRVHASEAGLMLLADSLARQPTFTRQPLWRGQCAETGPWARLRQATPEALNTPWLRLGARLAELVRLALAIEAGGGGAAWLALGSLATARHAGLAWVEMARGLLLHHVQLDGDGNEARVAACQVLAPTEWNFHPQGAVARTLELMPTPRTPGPCLEVDLLFSAYDPCVKHEIMTSSPIPEPTQACHA